jgi:hypothetical protein
VPTTYQIVALTNELDGHDEGAALSPPPNSSHPYQHATPMGIEPTAHASTGRCLTSRPRSQVVYVARSTPVRAERRNPKVATFAERLAGIGPAILTLAW